LDVQTKHIDRSAKTKKREILSVAQCSSGHDEDILYRKIRTKNINYNQMFPPVAPPKSESKDRTTDPHKLSFKPSFQRKSPTNNTKAGGATSRQPGTLFHTHAPSLSQPQNVDQQQHQQPHHRYSAAPSHHIGAHDSTSEMSFGESQEATVRVTSSGVSRNAKIPVTQRNSV
jgi:hypothetical protein